MHSHPRAATLPPVKIDLISPHSPINAATRLKQAVDDRLDLHSSKRVTGNGTEHEMLLWVHRPGVRNDFKTMLRAKMEPHEGGTRIRGRVGAPISAGLFMGCWFTFVSLFMLFGLVMTLSASAGEWTRHVPFVGVPLLMIGMGAFMLWIGRRNGRADRDTLLAFLHRTLQTRDRRDKML